MNRQIRFQGKEYILTEGGAIATQTAIEEFRESFAHLFEDGLIRRYGKIIGKKSDIEILGDSDVDHILEEFFSNAFSRDAWPNLFK